MYVYVHMNVLCREMFGQILVKFEKNFVKNLAICNSGDVSAYPHDQDRGTCVDKCQKYLTFSPSTFFYQCFGQFL
jgi:hypothetical protein